MNGVEICHREVERLRGRMRIGRRDDLERDRARVDVEAMTRLTPTLNTEERLVKNSAQRRDR